MWLAAFPPLGPAQAGTQTAVGSCLQLDPACKFWVPAYPDPFGVEDERKME